MRSIISLVIILFISEITFSQKNNIIGLDIIYSSTSKRYYDDGYDTKVKLPGKPELYNPYRKLPYTINSFRENPVQISGFSTPRLLFNKRLFNNFWIRTSAQYSHAKFDNNGIEFRSGYESTFSEHFSTYKLERNALTTSLGLQYSFVNRNSFSFFCAMDVFHNSITDQKNFIGSFSGCFSSGTVNEQGQFSYNYLSYYPTLGANIKLYQNFLLNYEFGTMDFYDIRNRVGIAYQF